MNYRPPALVALVAALITACPSTSTAQPKATVTRFPVQSAGEVAPDVPLQLTFSEPVTLGTAGRIVIKDSAGVVADTIDLAAAAKAPAPGGGGFSRPPSAVSRLVGGVTLRYQPVTVEGQVVTIRPHVTLAYGRNYSVTIEPGVIQAAVGPGWDGGLADWTFATKAAPPVAKDGVLTVAADGTGDFCTVQGAIDSIQPSHEGRITILIRRGVYHEFVEIPRGKDRITLRGEDRHQSIIAAANNAIFNPGHRTMVSVDADDITIQNLTLHNLTPKGGKQAEALQVRAARCQLLDDDFFSFQDTLRIEGGVYVKNCFVAGDVDFVWGNGTVFFDRCTLRALNNGYLVQSRNNAERVGYVFDHCTLETAPAATRVVLARIHPKGYPYSNVTFLSCRLGPGILPEGWELDQGTDRDHVAVPAAAAANRPEGQNSAPVDNAQPAPNVRFWEYQSTDLAGQPIDVSHRLSVSRQLTAAEVAPLSDPVKVLGTWVSRAP